MLKYETQNSDIDGRACRTNRVMRFGAIGIIILMLALVFLAAVELQHGIQNIDG